VTIITHPLFGLAVGAGVTWLVAWYYFKRAGEELRREAAMLHKATSLVLAYLENQRSDVTVQRDSEGRVIGLIVGMRASGRVSITGHATL
jgi:hypothetical protein